MSDRKRRKKNKLRGQRTMGAGNTKNRRGAGSRGGRGKAGSNKHKFHSIGRLKPVKYRLKSQRKGKAIQLGVLNQMLEILVLKGKAKKEGEKYIVDKKSGFEKVLSQGEATHKIILKINASKGAISKIIKAGGKFEYVKKDFKQEETIFSGDAEEEDLEFEEVEGETEEKNNYKKIMKSGF
ncbi:MAG: uL15 family ribosomal protein [Candidatus Diapherotrites archaeon]|nr:uL15 family ribosomal protein [Candidatus Diapherotrites archaeon]